jgi:hypothetical protein
MHPGVAPRPRLAPDGLGCPSKFLGESFRHRLGAPAERLGVNGSTATWGGCPPKRRRRGPGDGAGPPPVPTSPSAAGGHRLGGRRARREDPGAFAPAVRYRPRPQHLEVRLPQHGAAHRRIVVQQHQEAVGNEQRPSHVMVDHQRGEALPLLERRQSALHPRPSEAVELAERLVQHRRRRGTLAWAPQRASPCRRTTRAGRRWRSLEADRRQGPRPLSRAGREKRLALAARSRVAAHPPPWVRRRVLEHVDAERLGSATACGGCAALTARPALHPAMTQGWASAAGP